MNTYFKTSKVSEKSGPKRERIKLKLPKLPPYTNVIILAVVLIAAVSVFAFKNSRIKNFVRQENEIKITAAVEKRSAFFASGGEVNAELVRRAVFAGDAVRGSKLTPDWAHLVSMKNQGWASFDLELEEPIDLSSRWIRYTARSDRGGDMLYLMIVDSSNRSYRIEEALNAKLTRDWQTYTVAFKPPTDTIDIKDIKTIRFEFGSLTAGNSQNTSIFLKDIYAKK